MTHLLRNLKRTFQSLLRKGSDRKPGFSMNVVRQWWPFLRPHRGLCLSILLLSLVTSLISSVLPLSTKFIIDGATQKTDLPGWSFGGLFPVHGFLSQMMAMGAVVLVLLVLFHVCSFFLQVLSFRLEQRFVLRLQRHLFKHVLRFPLAFFGKRTSNYLTQRILGDVDVAQNLLHTGATQILTHVFRTLGCLLVLFHLSGVLTAAVALSIPVFALVSVFFASGAFHLSWNEREKEARIGEEVQESFAGIETVKAFNTYPRQTGRLAERLLDAASTRERELLAGLMAHYSERLVQIVVCLVVLGLGLYEISEARFTMGGLVAYFSNMGILAFSVSELLEIHLHSQPYIASLQRIRRLLKKAGEGEKPLITGGEAQKAPIPAPIVGLGDPKPGPGEIQFTNVTFGYDPQRVIVKDLSFRVKRGQILALMGRSGIGKTTVAKLLQGFYRPQVGEILVDGVSLSTLDLREFRANIGFVSQDLFLFRDTVASNIGIACPGTGPDNIRRACEIAQIHRDIEKLPQGYETMIGERGANLSVGQRQRLCIARALVHQPPIFIFDEPTSALDIETERALLIGLKAVLGSGMTMIISHKPSLAEWADVVVTLNEPKT